MSDPSGFLRMEDVAGSDVPRLRYLPAVDGLRALAVAAVIGYHAAPGLMPGGFLGVDVFFVISGFLITALLVSEWRRTGGIDLLRFWKRRARRLLPALCVLLAVVSVAVPLLAPDQAHRLRADLLAALTYSSNWRFILEHQSYFEAIGRPPVLQHLWSLAVEEQFYVVWPLVLLLALRWRSPRRLTVVALALAALSAGAMAALHGPGDPSRVYYGTDTRLIALLAGAALAFSGITARPFPSGRPTARRASEAAAAIALFGLAVMVVGVSEFDLPIYPGGFVAASAFSAIAVATISRPGSRFGAMLAARPLVWLGRRSYGIYLWFWPVLMLSRPGIDIPFGGPLVVAAQAGAAVLLGALSYRYVEQPARAGALGRLWDDVRSALARRSRAPRPALPAFPAVALGTGVVVVAIGSALAVTRRPLPPPTASVAASIVADSAVEPLPPPTTVTTSPPRPQAPTAAVAAPARPAASRVTATPAEATVLPLRVTAIGESVMLLAKPSLEKRISEVQVDSAVGRQFTGSLTVARRLRDEGRLGDAVVVHVGHNGPVTDKQFEELMDALQDVRRVVVVNVKVPRAWERHNNKVLAEGVSRWRNAVLLDWNALGQRHPEAFNRDGVHMTPAGTRLYVDALVSALD